MIFTTLGNHYTPYGKWHLNANYLLLQLLLCTMPQIRLDFENFVITGPATSPTAVVETIGGVAVPGTGVGNEVTLQTQCLTDTFQVVAGGGTSNSDVICGTNSNEHCKLANNEQRTANIWSTSAFVKYLTSLCCSYSVRRH